MQRGARKEGLSRRHRFAAQGSFGPVLRSPGKLRGAAAVLHVASGTPGISRIGVALARRNVASSVLRNRVKRLVRELFRRHPVKAGGLDLVVALRGRFEPLAAKALAEELLGLLDQANARTGR